MPDIEAKLVEKAKSGHKPSYGKLVTMYQDKILYLAYDLVGSYEDAKDIAQTAFIKAYTKLDTFEERSKFSTWLYRITVNLALDWRRRDKRKKSDSLEERIEKREGEIEFESGERPTDDNVQVKEMRKILSHGLEKLTFNQRTAVTLKYLHQHSSKEIAEVLGCNESTARIHIHRALGNLRTILSSYKDSYKQD